MKTKQEQPALNDRASELRTKIGNKVNLLTEEQLNLVWQVLQRPIKPILQFHFHQIQRCPLSDHCPSHSGSDQNGDLLLGGFKPALQTEADPISLLIHIMPHADMKLVLRGLRKTIRRIQQTPGYFRDTNRVMEHYWEDVPFDTNSFQL